MRELILFIAGTWLWTGWAYAEYPANAYRAEWAAWHQKRIDRLTAEDGFSSLAGLYWLAESEAGEQYRGDH